MDDLQLPARRITPWISPESGGTISTAAHRRARGSVEPARTRRARAPRPGDGSMGGAGHPVHFLDACFLCRKPLAGNRDIFMYRGDTAFCSEECRTAQMEADEAAERTERACARRLTHGPPPAREVEDPQECGNKVRAGSVLAL